MRALAAALAVVLGSASSALPGARAYAADPDVVRCEERADLPRIEHVTVAKWSPDGTRLAATRITTVPDPTNITGWDERLVVDVMDVPSGAIREWESGQRPDWSPPGTYLSFWYRGLFLIERLSDARLMGVIDPTIPEVRWIGDQVIYISKDEIRLWSYKGDNVITRIDSDFVPKYPKDDVAWSADGERFTLTRYDLAGDISHWVGTTATGRIEPLDDGAQGDILYTEWSPVGKTLLVRYADRIALRDDAGTLKASPLRAFAGRMHGWTPDGKRLLVGPVSPIAPGGTVIDRFVGWDGETASGAATLPNLFGSRAFSPDGRYFAGTARTGLYGMELEIFRCTQGTLDATGSSGARPDDAAAKEWNDRVAADPRRFVRPVAGFISDLVQGSHTGIDVAAPQGTLVTADDDGVVTLIGWHPAGGERVCVQHLRGLESCFYHLSYPLVSTGQRVVRGQPIAGVGLTGITTGPHVHWEVKFLGRVVDPLER